MIIYELYVDRFAGNFEKLTRKLEYFVWLGVDTLWILPHYPSPMIDGGYDISDYKNVRSELGSLVDFEEFVDQAHEKGLKVMTDMVLNHTSIEHPWFGAKPDWYIWGDDPEAMPEATVVFPDIKEKNWVWNEERKKYYYATFYPQQPDLNWDNPEVVQEMLDTMDYWWDKGVDGMRLDAVGRLFKRAGTDCYGLPETHAMLKKIRSHIDEKYDNRVLLAETGGWPDQARKFFGDGDECQLVMHFQMASEMLAGIYRPRETKLTDGLGWALFLTNHDSIDLWFLENEAERREFATRVDPDNLYSWQVGESLAARLGEVCKGDEKKIIEATRILLEQTAVPILYYGNEIGMRNEKLAVKPIDTREYVRGKFDWDELELQKFDPDSIVNKVRNLIMNKKNN